jgi:hypothetical protein
LGFGLWALGFGLWDIEDIAYFFGVDKSKAHEIKSHPKFPRPVKPYPGSHPKYLPEEVKDFAKKQRG